MSPGAGQSSSPTSRACYWMLWAEESTPQSQFMSTHSLSSGLAESLRHCCPPDLLDAASPVVYLWLGALWLALFPLSWCLQAFWFPWKHSFIWRYNMGKASHYPTAQLSTVQAWNANNCRFVTIFIPLDENTWEWRNWGKQWNWKCGTAYSQPLT